MKNGKEKIDQRLELLLTKREKTALKRLAEQAEVSMGQVLRSALRTQAKRKKLWV